MKVFFDLIPVILFFIGFKLYGIFVATAIAIGATLVLIAYSKIKHGKIEKIASRMCAILPPVPP